MPNITHLSSPTHPWGKSYTSKRYVHPPLAESMVTFWPHSMVMIGETMGGATPQTGCIGRWGESRIDSCAMAFVYRGHFLDLRGTQFHTRPDGIPIHSQTKVLPKFTLWQEVFSDASRVPAVYSKAIIRNTTGRHLTDTLSLIARTGPELLLVGTREPDGYFEPEPSYARWGERPLWEYSDGKMTDGLYTVHYRAEGGVTVDYRDPFVVKFDLSLAPGEEAALYFTFGRGKLDPDFSYDAERARAEAFWQTELSKMQRDPVAGDPELDPMFKSMVAQGLQMFSFPQNCNYVILRQGGLQRLLWPTDIRSMIRALARVGGYESYLNEILNTYFHVMQSRRPENYGQIVNFGIPWGSVTGSVLFAYGACAMYSEELYARYRDEAYAAFRWIESQRELTHTTPGLVGGLFPPALCSDYPADGQMWAFTDLWNLAGYALYLQAMRIRGDARLSEVEAAWEDYYAAAKGVLDRAAEQYADSDIIVLPLDARNIPEIEAEMEKRILTRDFHDYMALNMGLAGFDTEEARKVLRQYAPPHMERGLTHPFAPSEACPEEGRRWYGTWADLEMYFYYRSCGMDDRAREILDAQLDYLVTAEYYVAERYDSHDPYYTPWCPNCSGNGRIMTMLFDWYTDREQGIINGVKQ